MCAVIASKVKKTKINCQLNGGRINGHLKMGSPAILILILRDTILQKRIIDFPVNSKGYQQVL
jgi:hypothetical protein